MAITTQTWSKFFVWYISPLSTIYHLEMSCHNEYRGTRQNISTPIIIKNEDISKSFVLNISLLLPRYLSNLIFLLIWLILIFFHHKKRNQTNIIYQFTNSSTLLVHRYMNRIDIDKTSHFFHSFNVFASHLVGRSERSKK